MKKIRFIFLLLVIAAFAPLANAQNLPDASTAPAGTATTEALPANFSGVTLYNYTRTWVPQVNVSDAASLTETSPAATIPMTTTYTDGLGRVMQKVYKEGAVAGWDWVEIPDNRPSMTSLGLLPYARSGNNGKFKPNAYTEQRDYYLGLYPDEDATAYSKTSYNNWVTKEFSPGKATVGQDRGKQSTVDFNEVSNNVAKYVLDINTYLPVLTGFYGAKELMRKTETTADGSVMLTFTDAGGKIISTRIRASACPTCYTITYYVYDNLDRPVYTITPKAVEKASAFSGNINTNIAENLCSYQRYDSLGRVYEKHVQGETGNEYIVFDRKNRPVFTQTPLLKSQGRWAYTQYDAMDRVVSTGLYTTSYSRASLQNILDGKMTIVLPGVPAGSKPVELFQYLMFDVYEGIYPDLLNNCFMHTINYYDNYSYATSLGRHLDLTTPASGLQASYMVDPDPFVISDKVKGKLTATRTRVLKPAGSGLADWTDDLFFYDIYGRLIQAQQKNVYGVWDYISNQYDFSGKLLMTVSAYNNPSCSTKSRTVIARKNIYNTHTFTLSNVQREIDYGGWNQVAAYTYDKSGVVARKTIGDIETQDYSYNIRGQLTGINQPYAEELVPSNAHFFGEALKYEYGFNQKLYSGNASGMIWRNAGKSPRMCYGYSYDLESRLTGANYMKGNETPTPFGTLYGWSKSRTDYSVANLAYDFNGNITSMSQMGVPAGATSPVIIDDLSYTYRNAGVSDQLESVTDAVAGSTNSSYKLNDFVDNNTASSDYTYDVNGNLKTDLNKDITNISYNFLDLPERIDFTGGRSIVYTYDASGTKISQEINDGTALTTYEYTCGAVYKNKVLQYAPHSEGVSRYHEKNPGVWGWDNDFFITDHQGNVRSVVTAEPRSWLDYEATYEIANAGVEESFFTALPALRVDKPFPGLPGDIKAALLDANDASRRVGSALMLKVMPGDQFELGAENYYEPYNPAMDQPVPDASIFESILGTLVAPGGNLPGMEGGAGAALLGQMFSPENYLNTYQGLVQSTMDPSRPKAYINYLVFDNDMNLVAAESGAVQVSSQGQGQWQLIGTPGPITIGTNGYLVTYLSSASTAPVFFNNFKIRFNKGKLQREQHYYPYGLAIDAGSMDALPKKYLYQGKELQEELALMWQDFHARQYDPQIGRFTSIDPKGQYHSGYTGMGDNPVMGRDPDGKFWHIVIGAAIGGVINLGLHAYRGQIKDWKDAGVAFGIGAVAGGAAAATGGASLALGGGASVASIAASSAISGGISYSVSQPILEGGNNIYFHDPVSSPEEAWKGLATSIVFSGLTSGIVAKLQGLPWINTPTPPTPPNAPLLYEATTSDPQLASIEYAQKTGAGELKGINIVIKKPVGADGALPDAVFSSKAPMQVTPGTLKLEGQYMNDLGHVQPWKASYDKFGRLIERTDWNAANPAANIEKTHHHLYEYLQKMQMRTLDHIPGVGPTTNW